MLADHRASITDWITTHAGGLGRCSVAENPHSRPGTPLYNRFVRAWEAVQDQSVRLVFHGTAEANIESICQTGLDPRRRAGQAHGPGEYFASNVAVSVPYCRGGRKMLVFAVLTDRSGITADTGSIIVVHKPEHQLPLFVMTMMNESKANVALSAPPAIRAAYAALRFGRRFPPPQSRVGHGKKRKRS